MRLPLEIACDVRAIWPQDKPLYFRLSAADGSGASSGGAGRADDYPSGYGPPIPYAIRIAVDAG